MFGSGELFNHYQTNFMLMDRFKYDIPYFDNLIPYEREVYISMLINRLDKEAKSQ
jgi:hypothetical protein